MTWRWVTDFSCVTRRLEHPLGLWSAWISDSSESLQKTSHPSPFGHRPQDGSLPLTARIEGTLTITTFRFEGSSATNDEGHPCDGDREGPWCAPPAFRASIPLKHGLERTLTRAPSQGYSNDEGTYQTSNCGRRYLTQRAYDGTAGITLAILKACNGRHNMHWFVIC